MAQRIGFLVLTSVSIMLGFSNPAFAVCLGGHPSVEQEFSSSTLVIEGIAKSTKPVTETETRMDGQIYLIEITRTLKGESLSTIEIFSENSSGRFTMELGASYRLFLTKGADGWHVDNCGNSSLSSAPRLRVQ